MKFNYEWYLSDGSVLKGETAKKHLLAKLHSYKELMKNIDCILSRSLENNHIVEYGGVFEPLSSDFFAPVIYVKINWSSRSKLRHYVYLTLKVLPLKNNV